MITQGYHSIIDTPELRRFLKIGGVHQSHMMGRKENLAILNAEGIKKINVHVRDPRQSFFSTTHWIDFLHRSPDAGYKSTRRVLEALRPDGFFDLPFEQRVDYMIEHQLRLDIEWIEDWLKASEESGHGFEIQITRFEDYKKDYDSFFASLLKFFEIDLNEFKGERGQSKPRPDGMPGEHGIRKGQIDEWRTSTTDRQRRRIAEIVPQKLLQRLGYPLD